MVRTIRITTRSCQKMQFNALDAIKSSALSVQSRVLYTISFLFIVGRQNRSGGFTIRSMITIFALCLPGSVFAADYCSEDNLSNVERMVCESGLTMSLDAKLNEAYLRLMRVGKDQPKYKAEQRKWIAEVREKCLEQECLTREYSSRIMSLLEELALSQEINESRMTDSEAKEICNGVSELARNRKLEAVLTPGLSDGLLNLAKVESENWIVTEAEREAIRNKLFGLVVPDTIFSLRLGRRKSLTKFASFFTGGSCSSYNVYNVALISDPRVNDNGIDEVPDPDDEIRWATWGSGEYPGVYNQRNILISGSVGSPGMVSWIKPDGRIRPLCLLQAVSKKRVEGSYKDRGVCEAIANNKAEKNMWSDVTDALPIKKDYKTFKEEFIGLFGSYAERVETQLVDIDGDGSYEHIARFTYNSSGGCGGDHEWLGLIAEGLDGLRAGPMNDALQQIEGSSIEVFLYKEDHYIGSQGGGWGSQVYRFGNGSFDKVCDFHESVESEIGEVFSLQ